MKRARNHYCKAEARRTETGFTLIEVVIALTIFALMSGILYGAFALGHSAVEKAQRSAAQSQKQRSVGDLVGSYLRSAFPYKASTQDLGIFFQGEIDGVAFISAYSQGLGGRGMARIQITANEDENGQTTLKLEEATPVRLDSQAGGSGLNYDVVLQEGVRELRLAYLDPQPDEETWEERWDGQERRALPRAVRITYLDDQGKSVRWIFPLMMTVLAP